MFRHCTRNKKKIYCGLIAVLSPLNVRGVVLFGAFPYIVEDTVQRYSNTITNPDWRGCQGTKICYNDRLEENRSLTSHIHTGELAGESVCAGF